MREMALPTSYIGYTQNADGALLHNSTLVRQERGCAGDRTRYRCTVRHVALAIGLSGLLDGVFH